MIEIIVAIIAAAAVISGPILLSMYRMRRDNRSDHNRVVTSVEVLATQVAALTAMVVDSVSELRAHVKWEETRKYASHDDIIAVIQAIAEKDGAGDSRS